MKDHPSQFVHVRTESVNRFSRCMRQKQLQPRRRRDWNRRKKSRKEKKTVLREIVITATKEEIIVDVMTDVTTARTVRQFQSQSWKVRSHREAYGQAKLENVRTLAELAVAQTTYDKYLAEQKAQEAAAQAKADEESRKETEKIRQVFEQKDAADKYDNSKIAQKAMSVKTGDKANAGGMLAVAGVAGMIAALAQKIKRREQD